MLILRSLQKTRQFVYPLFWNSWYDLINLFETSVLRRFSSLSLIFSIRIKKSFLTPRENEKIVPLRILQRDISVLNEKIGYAIFNEEKKYYIKSENEKKEVITILLNAIKQVKKESELWERWNYLKLEYEHWRYILRENNVCFYDQKNEILIENEILPLKKEDA